MEVLDYKQMASLINSVTERITKELYIANRLGTLEEVLKKYDLEEEKEIVSSCYLPNSKVLIIGAVNANKNDIYKTFSAPFLLKRLFRKNKGIGRGLRETCAAKRTHKKRCTERKPPGAPA